MLEREINPPSFHEKETVEVVQCFDCGKEIEVSNSQVLTLDFDEVYSDECFCCKCFNLRKNG